jgi:hypothetical protein
MPSNDDIQPVRGMQKRRFITVMRRAFFIEERGRAASHIRDSNDGILSEVKS